VGTWNLEGSLVQELKDLLDLIFGLDRDEKTMFALKPEVEEVLFMSKKSEA
jgi:hypothetical protein